MQFFLSVVYKLVHKRKKNKYDKPLANFPSDGYSVF